MRKNIYYAVTIIFFVFLIFPVAAKADAFAIHFFYDIKTKTLRFDNAVSEPVSHDPNKYVSVVEFSKNTQPGSYILKIYDPSNNEIVSTEFNKQNGAFELDIPYFSLGYNMKVLNKSTGKEILNADLSKFNTCNGNGICEYEKGENITTCLGRLRNQSYHIQRSNKKFAPTNNNGILKDPKTGETLLQDKAFASGGFSRHFQ